MSNPQAVGALVLGALLGAGGLFVAQSYLPTEAQDCGGLCGEGTACLAGRCELAPPDEPDEPELAEDEGTNKRKGKRRRKRGGGGDDGELDEGGAAGPPVDDDSHVPRFDPNADQSISMSDGTGRLSDGEIDRELTKLDGRFQACVRDGAARVADIGTGTVKFSFGVDGKGKVTGVNASAPANLKDAGIVPCVRKAIHGHKFPGFNGPVMKVSSSFSVD